MKLCTKCKTEKENSEFYKCKRQKNNLTCWCKGCLYEYTKNWRKNNWDKVYKSIKNRRERIRTWYDEYKSTLKCEICGESHPACLEFHHINPREKELSIGKKSSHSSIKTLKKEINKCKVLCSNCHRKFHYEQKKM